MRIIENKLGCDFYTDISKATCYQRVSCDFYDELCNLVVLKKDVTIFLNEEKHKGKLLDVYTKNKEEFCVIGDKHIRLDRIIEVEVQ
jgi:transcriptional antiterminator Rof (Rho-off)